VGESIKIVPGESRQVFNAYCDESCHLEHDHKEVMGFGLIAVAESEKRRLALGLRAIKARYGCRGELKWTKVSPKNVGFYCEVVDFFFREEALSFRVLVVRDKGRLDHEGYNEGSHDLFYFKMYYYLVRNVVEYDTDKAWNIYLDIKDSKSAGRVRTLRDVLRTKFRDTSGELIARIQQLRSHESELLQLADFLLGAVMYAARKENGSLAKLTLVKRIGQRSHLTLRASTAPWESKFNLFYFKPRKG